MILGSIAQNLGQNLISLDHKEKVVLPKSVEVDVEEEDVGNTDIESNNGGEESEDGKQEFETLRASIAQTVKDVNQKESTYVICGKEIQGKHLRTVGIVTLVCGALATFGAFGFGSQSLLASLESIQFVSNVAFAKYVHREPITRRMVLATLCIIAGNCLVVAFSSHEPSTFNSDQLLALYRTNTEYHAYLIVAGILWFASMYTFRTYYDNRIKFKKKMWMHNLVEPSTFIFSTTIIGTQAVLQSKCMSMLIQVSGTGTNEFVKAPVYLILVAWVSLVAFFLRRMDMALMIYPPLFIIPVVQVFFIILAIICGGIYFEEFSHFSTSQWCGFLFGVLFIIVGVYGLAPTDVDIIGNLGNHRDSVRIAGPNLELLRQDLTKEIEMGEVNPMLERRTSKRMSITSNDTVLAHLGLNEGGLSSISKETVNSNEPTKRVSIRIREVVKERSDQRDADNSHVVFSTEINL